MDNIIEPTIDYDFSKLYLASPTSLSGGAYFTRIFLNNKPLYIQTPKCLTKQGFVKSGKRIYTDLMFNNSENVIIQWLENLETKCHELIYAKGDTWFDSKLEKSDIESAFTPPIKIFKSGKFYLLRVNVKPNIKIYNEVDQVIGLETVTPEMNIISILEIQGIKFTSRYFQIEMELKQSMVVSPDPFLDECFIKKPILNSKSNSNSTSSYATTYTKDNTVHYEPTKNTSNLITNSFSNDENENTFLSNLDVDLEIDFKENTITPISILKTGTNGRQDNTSKQDNTLKKKKDVNLEEEDLDIEEVNIDDLNIEDSKDLTEVDFNSSFDDKLETITLKKPNEVYYKVYKAAREKAKLAKKEAILAFLEAKNIKTTYMLEGLGDSDSDIDNELDSLEEMH